MFGYADESGEPGVKKNENDFFVFCIVLFKDKHEIEKAHRKIVRFRKKYSLPEDHEFHFATDSKRIRLEFVKFVHNLNFEYLSISIKKDSTKNKASFIKMAKLVLKLIEEKQINATIVMDVNPSLYSELRRHKKDYDITLHISESKSHSNDFIQVADYVTAIHTRYLKYPEKRSTAEAYASIVKKMVGFIKE